VSDITRGQGKNPENIDINARIVALEAEYVNLLSRVKDTENVLRYESKIFGQAEIDGDRINLLENDDYSEESGDYSDEVDSETDRAWDALVDEAKRRHTLTMETFNSTMQRIGFLLAFTPILFVEAVDNIKDVTDFVSYGPAILTAVCFVSGVSAIVIWWTPSFGVYTDDLISDYNNKDWIGVQERILSGAVDGFYEILDRTANIRIIMNIMVLSLLFGSAALVCEMLGNRIIMEMIFYIGMGTILGYSSAEIHDRFVKNESKSSNDYEGGT